MKSHRVFAAVLFAAVLAAGPTVASAADCCPPGAVESPTLAAAGCCGGCPSALTPIPEPASLSLKASRPDSSPDVALAAPELALRPLEGIAAVPVGPSPLVSPPRVSPVPLRI